MTEAPKPGGEDQVDARDRIGRDGLAALLARGVARALAQHGIATVSEFTLRSGRRVDVIGIDGSGQVTVVEIKTCVEDFRADGKWLDYLEYCDRFLFAVPAPFPREILPADCGLMVADPYGAVILREPPLRRLDPSRRRAQMIRFARVAARRLNRLIDPA